MATPLALDGELTIYRAAELRAALLAALEAGPALALDLSGCTEIDCAGVQLLLAAQRSAAEAGGAVRLQARSEAVDDALATLGLAERFAVEAS